jgi:putative hydrolase of the HAD superfamily
MGRCPCSCADRCIISLMSSPRLRNARSGVPKRPRNMRLAQPETRRARRKAGGARIKASSRLAASAIEAVTFDVGGTLIEVCPSVGHVYAEVAARYGVSGVSASVLNRRFVAAWRNASRFRHSRSDWARLVDATFRGLADLRPSRTFFKELYTRFADADVWRVYDDVVSALEALASRGLKLAVISNWDERLRPLLKRLRLARHFEEIIVSREVGAAKPSRRIFWRAARRLKLPPEAILHVGDDSSMDVLGGRAAGFSALLLNRRGRAGRPGEIRSLRELVARVRRDDMTAAA